MTDRPEAPSEPASPFDQHIGTEWGETGAEHASARLVVEDHHKQPLGMVHGGVLATVAESVVSRATAIAVAPDGMTAMGQSHQISFLRPISGGTIAVEARRRHGGRTTWVWDVEIGDSEGRICALSRVVVAVRPAAR